MRFLFLLAITIGCSNEGSFIKSIKDGNDAVTEEQFASTVLVEQITKTEVFTVEKVDSSLDILLIVDDSGSMGPYNGQLKDNLNPLLEHIADSDWQIVIKTTSMQGCFRAQIREGETDYETKFEDAIAGIISGGDGGEEEAIQVATKALREEFPLKSFGENLFSGNLCDNGSKLTWLRDNSVVAILIVSDEDVDATCDTNRDGTNGCIDTFYDQLATIRDPHVTAKIYGILSPNDESTSDLSRREYMEWRDKKENKPLFDLYTSISGDFNEVLGQISENIADSLQSIFSLEKVSNGNMIEVILIFSDGEEETLHEDEYKIENKNIIINELPEEAQRIKVIYTYDADRK